MKLKINFKKVISAFILIVVICTTITGLSNSVYGKINEYYSTGETSGTINVDQAVKDAPVLNSVAHFIYAIAGFIEYIVSVIMGSITGSEVFPWADRVIFNTMPFLDINFLSPSTGSMFRSIAGTDTMFGTIIKNLYYTIFVLSVTFFGVVVGIMALKLAISSIAAEKAKYKQAITNWLLALILLFTAHYLISFIFFVNEKMVEVASTILKEQIEDTDLTINIDSFSDADCKKIIDLLLESAFEGSHNEISYSAGGSGLGCQVQVPVWGTDMTCLMFEAYQGSNDDEYHRIYQPSLDELNEFFVLGNTNALKNKNDEELLKKWNRYTCMLMLDSRVNGVRGIYDYETSGVIEDVWHTITTVVLPHSMLTSSDVAAVACLRDGAFLVALELYTEKLMANGEQPLTASQARAILDDNDQHLYFPYEGDEYKSMFTDATKQAVIDVYTNNILNSAVADETKDLLTNMSTFFKNCIYTYKVDENGKIASATASNFNAIPAILYAIFVIQSIMYFIAYIKRFFYIIVLALFAPLVIIYDFLSKTAMG